MQIGMEGSGPIEGKIMTKVSYKEVIDGLLYSAVVEVWVPDVDSRAAIKNSSLSQSRDFLALAISAHDAEYPQPQS